MYGYQGGYSPMMSNPYQNYNPYQYNQFQGNVVANETLSGTIVDSVDVVKGRNCSLDGSASYYPKSDKTEIYVKQLNPQTGAGMIQTYRLVTEESEKDDTSAQVTEFLGKLSSDLEEIKSTISNNMIVPRGGVQNEH